MIDRVCGEGISEVVSMDAFHMLFYLNVTFYDEEEVEDGRPTILALDMVLHPIEASSSS